jgi:mannose-6-phosphate isomerase-like protein (cupin superfamily)
MPAHDLATTFLRLRPDTSIEKLAAGDFWPRLMRGELGDFHHEYLVTTSEHHGNWPAWEMHPHGDEIVCLLSGAATFVLEGIAGRHDQIELNQPGTFAFVPRGTWHTARIAQAARFLFITAGEGTQHRPL